MDEIDSEILKLLREDGRISWRDLGAAVGLSANAASDRVRRLRQAGVITGLHGARRSGRRRPASLEALVGVTVALGHRLRRLRGGGGEARAGARDPPPQRHARLPAPGGVPRHGGARRAPPDAPPPVRRGGHRDHSHPSLRAAARSLTWAQGAPRHRVFASRNRQSSRYTRQSAHSCRVNRTSGPVNTRGRARMPRHALPDHRRLGLHRHAARRAARPPRGHREDRHRRRGAAEGRLPAEDRVRARGRARPRRGALGASAGEPGRAGAPGVHPEPVARRGASCTTWT